MFTALDLLSLARGAVILVRRYGNQLKPVDVAVIGLGAAGGVAVLPLAWRTAERLVKNWKSIGE